MKNQIDINRNIYNNTIKEVKELIKISGNVPVIITAQPGIEEKE